MQVQYYNDVDGTRNKYEKSWSLFLFEVFLQMHNIFYAHILYGIKVIINRMYYPSIIVNNTALLQQLRFTGIPSVILVAH